MGSVRDSGQQPPSRRHSALLTRLPRTTGASRNQAAPTPAPHPPAPAPSFQQRGGPLGPRTPRRVRRPSVLEPGGPGLTRACGRPARNFARACKCLHVTESEMDFYE